MNLKRRIALTLAMTLLRLSPSSAVLAQPVYQTPFSIGHGAFSKVNEYKLHRRVYVYDTRYINHKTEVLIRSEVGTFILNLQRCTVKWIDIYGNEQFGDYYIYDEELYLEFSKDVLIVTTVRW